jgi:hypothetical protein
MRPVFAGDPRAVAFGYDIAVIDYLDVFWLQSSFLEILDKALGPISADSWKLNVYGFG